MVIPEHQDGKHDDSLIAFKKFTEVVENTRQAGGQQQIDSAITPRIIVDMREFRSDLPCLIHRRGIQVVPVTITVNTLFSHHSLSLQHKNGFFSSNSRLGITFLHQTYVWKENPFLI